LNKPPAKYELGGAVIRFLLAEGYSAAEIHRWMSNVYGNNFMSDSCVRKWCRKFKVGYTDFHDEGGQGRKSVATEDIVEKVNEVVRERRSFTISEISQISRSALYDIVMKFGYSKSCERWASKSAESG